jgi:hypothetical protein
LKSLTRNLGNIFKPHGRNLSSINLNIGDKMVMGLKLSMLGMSGHTLFSGTNLALIESLSSAMASGFHEFDRRCPSFCISQSKPVVISLSTLKKRTINLQHRG